MDKDLALVLLVTFIVVVLPVSIVLICSLTSKAKYLRKFSFLEKCVENGVEINPELLIDQGKRSLTSRASLKTMLLNRLAGGVISLLIGFGMLLSDLTPFVKDTSFLPEIVLIAVGVGLLIWYFIGKKMLEEDIKDEKEALSQQGNSLRK